MTDKEHQITTYQSLITISTEGYKFLGLINGGALVAMLAFVGNLVSKDVKLINYAMPFYFFTYGLVACGMAMFFGYLTQFRVLNQKNEIVPIIIAMILYISSLGLFIAGCYSSINTFKVIEVQKTCLRMNDGKN